MERIRVKVYATDPITSAGVTAGLRPSPQLSVVDDHDLDSIDVVVVAVGQPAMSTEPLRTATEAGAPIVLLTNVFKESDLLVALECRVAAILSRATTSADELIRTIVSIASGDDALRKDPLVHLMEQSERLNREMSLNGCTTIHGLTTRDIKVLQLMAEGLDTQEIGRRLSYSERTVKNVIHAITTRINVRNRSQAVAYALRAGVI